MLIMQLNLLLGSIVLLVSTAFIIWSLRNKGEGSFFGLAIGSIVFIVALISILSMSFMGIKVWMHGKEMSMEMRKNRVQKLSPELIQKLKERREQMKNMQKEQNPQGQESLQSPDAEKR